MNINSKTVLHNVEITIKVSSDSYTRLLNVALDGIYMNSRVFRIMCYAEKCLMLTK